MRLYPILSLLFMLGCISAQANNIQVTNVTYEGVPFEYDYEVSFDISWENSWRTSTFESNYDAAWVFVKYRGGQYENWTHALLDGPDLPSPAGAEVNIVPNVTGAFIQRSSNGIGDVSFTNVRLPWMLDDFFEPGDIVEVCVYAIEMVYIPEGPFEVGDGLIDVDPLVRAMRFQKGLTNSPYIVASESPITLGGFALANLTSHAYSSPLVIPDDFNSSTTQNLPSLFPKGFSAFYCMKYEISQGQYTAFLNSIPADAAEDRFANEYGNGGYTIQLAGGPSYYEADSPDRAMNYMNWADLAFYADWSGLRPLSELEFEKVCRGSRSAIPREYAWGNASRWFNSYEIVNEGTPDERITNPSSNVGNANTYSALIFRPVRCGIFSSSNPNVDRQQSGAGYYGVYDLSGNVFETIVNVGTPQGRAFLAIDHGDGSPSVPPSSWPAISNEGVQVIGLGSGFKGGSFGQNINSQVSYRLSVNKEENSIRYGDVGGRLVRSNF